MDVETLSPQRVSQDVQAASEALFQAIVAQQRPLIEATPEGDTDGRGMCSAATAMLQVVVHTMQWSPGNEPRLSPTETLAAIGTAAGLMMGPANDRPDMLKPSIDLVFHGVTLGLQAWVNAYSDGAQVA